MPLHPFTTQIVGSYTKPHWLAHHDRAGTYDGSWWRPESDVLPEAREDAARLAIFEQERAGLDLVTDGEMQRASYDRHFLHGLAGIDVTRLDEVAHTGSVETRKHHAEGHEDYVRANQMGPQVVGEISWKGPVAVEELRFLKRHARRPVKITVAGPLSLSRRVVDQVYRDDEALVMALAAGLNQELRTLDGEGADVLQIDEPAFHSNVHLAQRFGKAAIERMVDGVRAPVIVHVCYGYALVYAEKSASPTYPQALEILANCPIAGISLEYAQPKHEPALLSHCGDKHVVIGLLDLASPVPETADQIADQLRQALEVVPAQRLHPASDCGMWYLPRDLAYAKIAALAEGTGIVRRELGLAEPAP